MYAKRTAVLCLVAMLFVASVLAQDDEKTKSEQKLTEARKSQEEVDQLTQETLHEMNRLEAEMQEKKRPLYQTRNSVLKNIRGFWGRVIESHPSHANWFRGDDKAILQNLIDITVTELLEENNPHQHVHRYRIAMEFSRNDFFADKILWRDISGSVEENPKASGVTWLPGKAPKVPSFWSFFEDPAIRAAEKLQNYQMNDIAHVIRYEFFPNPFTYHDLPNYADYINHHEDAQPLGAEHTHESPPPEVEVVQQKVEEEEAVKEAPAAEKEDKDEV